MLNMKRLLTFIVVTVFVLYGCRKSDSASVPVLTTAQVSDITTSTATGGGEITSDGSAAITARGVCWSVNSNPTISDQKTDDGSGSGAFVSSIKGLTAGTDYKVRAYATNSVGTSYGNEVSFTTGQLQLATLSTSPATSITATTAVSGGNITNDGGSDISSRGVCWSTLPGPTVADAHTTNGTGKGAFTSNLTALSEGSAYYVRSYATNSKGTAYGNEVTFVANAVPTSTSISISGMAFIPQTITVPVNTTIKWTNNDAITHTVTSDTGLFDSGNISNGGTFSYTFTTVGSFSYHCTIHPMMTATITVQ
jgi:plastocyanin